MAELMVEYPDFVEDERKIIESKDGRFIMAISHSSEQVDRDNLRVRVHVEADLDVRLLHDEKFNKDDRFAVMAAIAQCRNHINPPMAFNTTIGF